MDETPTAQQKLARRDSRAVQEQLWFVIPWLLGAGVVGVALWFIYAFQASSQGGACGPNGFLFASEWKGGGQASNGSVATAGVIGASLWLVGGVIYWLLGRSGGRLLLGFAVLDLAALVTLWYLSPLIWGLRHC